MRSAALCVIIQGYYGQIDLCDFIRINRLLSVVYFVPMCMRMHTSLLISFVMCVCDRAFCADFSPPASPLSVLFPPRECFGEVEPLPVWDWSTAWVEELEAQFKASRETRRTATSSRHSGIERWRGHLETPSHR